MSLTNLLDRIERAPGIQRLLESAAPTQNVAGLAGSSLSCVVAAVHRRRTVPTCVIVDTTEAAELLADDLASLLGPDQAQIFPAWEVRPYDHLSPAIEVIGQRIVVMDALLRGGKPLIIASVRALLQKTVTPDWLTATSLRLSTGATIHLEDLIKTCYRLGFERVNLVQAPGQYSVRGGIVDVFPHSLPKPCRVEFFGDEIESMRLFDGHTQRSTETIDTLTLLPTREILDDPSLRSDIADTVALTAMEAAMDASDLERSIRDGALFDGMERFFAFYHADAASLLSYLPAGSTLCFCERTDLRIEALRFTNEYDTSYTARIAAGDLVPAPGGMVTRFGDIEQQCAESPTVCLTRTTAPDDDWIDLSARNTGMFHGAIEVLQSRLAEWRNAHASIHIVCDNEGQTERLREILGPVADTLSMPIGSLHAGFVLPDLPLVVLTDSEIFSRYRRRRRQQTFKEGVVLEDFTSLREGDFVVHIDHGIGKYAGLQRLTVDERQRDCLAITYAEGDRLFIPIEQLHRVQKYIGSDGDMPTLTRLGGKTWEQMKARTRKAVQDIASDLIKLYASRQANPGFAFTADTPWQREMEDSFLYQETPDQLRATEEIKADMERVSPMDRLICGDVGYGKTEVAMRAAFKAVMDGKQVAALVPTTILAYQHLTTFTERFADYPITIRMLSRFVSAKDQKRVAEGLKNGEVDIVIGTHRLIQKDVEFKDLGLLIVDEEQRFGVTHKERLKQFKQTVDVLTLTATPIPRTLHMSLVGARDMTIINTPPRDRLPVHTEVARFDEEIIREAMLREIDRGGQVFFVHNRVQSITAMAAFLEQLVPEVSFVVGHGQMDERELEKIMIDFMDRKYDCLISTMIIESGLDIPNVNTILINRADRFGLSQMYQLRGRVGRSNHRAYAYLMIPASGAITPDARKRLAVITEYSALGSGFHIAMRDLEIRGAGNLLGAQQHGFVASVGFDLYCQLLQEAVQELKGEDPPDRTEASIDLRVGAFIPDEFVTERMLKVNFYQRLAKAGEEREIEAIRDEMRDRFGRIPDPTLILLDLVSIKLLAKAANVKSVTVREEDLIILYPENGYPSKSQISAVTRDARLPIEFPSSALFQIRVRLTGRTEVKRVELTKNLLQMLV